MTTQMLSRTLALSARILMTAVGSAALLSGTSGCVSTMAGWMDANYKASLSTTSAYTVPVAVEATTHNGSIVFVKGGTQVAVEATVQAQTQARADAVKLTTVSQPDGSLAITTTWPGERLNNEGVSLKITLPDATSISASTSNARIEVSSGFTATKATLRSSNGSITVSDLPGTVDAKTSNARVELTNVGSSTVDTSNGSVMVKLRNDATGPVTIETSNARVQLVVGSAFVGKVSLDTSNARISIDAPRATSTSVDGDEGSVSFGEGASSTIDTSNGSITVSESK